MFWEILTFYLQTYLTFSNTIICTEWLGCLSRGADEDSRKWAVGQNCQIRTELVLL